MPRLNRIQTSALILMAIGFANPSWVVGAQKGKNTAQERKDDARIQSARQDVNEAEKRIQNDLKEIKAAEVEAKKSFDLVTDAKQSLDEVTRRLEAWISQNLGIPDAMKAQKDAQTAYDEASKPLIASMKANPKYMPLVERAAKAELILKTPLTADNANDETLKQQRAAAVKEMADLRNAVSLYLESLPELKGVRDRLAASQSKLVDLRAQMKRQLEAHPDLRSAEKKWEQAKAESGKDAERVAALKRKVAADQSKLAAERSQLAKAQAQDKANDNRGNNNNKNKRNKK